MPIPIAAVSGSKPNTARQSASGPSSAIVAVAGTIAARGTYTFTGQSNGKNYYNKVGTSATVFAISWTGTEWAIFDSGSGILYSNVDNVAEPWEAVSLWDIVDGDAPRPTVSEG